MKTNSVTKSGKAIGFGLVVAACVFGRSFVSSAASGGLTSVIALQRPVDATAEGARGTVTVRQGLTSQEFNVDVRGIVPEHDTPVGGLGVYLSQAPFGTNNFYFVNVLKGSTNGNWRLQLKTGPAAPPQLGVSDVTNLIFRTIRIADAATNVYLESIVPEFVASPSAVSYRQRAALTRPGSAPSPDATGQIIVKLDGVRGTSVLDVRARKLATGNSYCLWLLPALGTPTPACPPGSNLVRRVIRFGGDTRKGEQLVEGVLSNGVVRIDQLSGAAVEVHDNFGAIHLEGIIP